MEEGRGFLTISGVSQRLHVPKHTLRFWEKEFSGFLAPRRTRKGQRRFSRKDLLRIEEIKKMRDRGRSLAEIKQRLSHGDSKQDPLQNIGLLSSRGAEAVRSEVFDFFSRNLAGDEP